MLDITDLKKKLDTHDMYGMIDSMPAHLAEGMSLAEDIMLGHLEIEAFQNIVLAGMGGSAIAGDLARSYLQPVMDLPFIISRHYCLPAFVNKKSLVICSSYSGETEETLSAYDYARDRGAKIISIATGGKLAEKSAADNFPLVRLKKGLPPRAALGFSFAALLTILGRLGICDSPAGDIDGAINSMKRWRSRYEPSSPDNPALKLAGEIMGRIPVIYSGCELLDSVATRFKCQISENAESLAFVNVFPEQNHNELVGWSTLYGLEDKLIAIILSDKKDHKRIKLRMEIVAGYLSERGIKVITLENEGDGGLERMFYFIQYLDFASYYLALLNGVDPFEIKPIDYLKNRLSAIS